MADLHWIKPRIEVLVLRNTLAETKKNGHSICAG